MGQVLASGNARSEWSHRTVLDCRPPQALAAASVRHHLLAHRRFESIDLATTVASKLASDPVLQCREPLVLNLSGIDAVIVVRVHTSAASWTAAQGTPVAAESVGTMDFGLLTLRWGVSTEGHAVTGLWATVDARRHSSALLAVAPAVACTGDWALEAGAQAGA